MADQEHLDILKQGVDVWNKWRDEHQDQSIDLREANLSGAKLKDANLSNLTLNVNHLSEYALLGLSAGMAQALFRRSPKVDLSKANFQGSDLKGTHLIGAILNRANLFQADLSDADLRGADLSEATLLDTDLTNTNFEGTDLSDANLSGATLSGAHFKWTNLSRTDFNSAMMTHTLFANVDLSLAKGLDTVKHLGPSEISLYTIYNSKGNIPEAFLRGFGIPNSFIEYMRSLIGNPIDYYSCFISYSSKDDAFASRLYADLQNNGVRCWFAPHDLKWGEKIHTGIDEAIYLHDKLLLILSKHSVASGWVEHEMKTARAKERKAKRTVLFPIRLDKAVLDSPLAWATIIRHEHNIGDFTKWKRHDDYQKAFNRLLRELKAE